jgi:mannose-6-phosphate isomerase-like protein (cupin superfamily)
MSVQSGANYSLLTVAEYEPLIKSIYSTGGAQGDVAAKKFLGDELKATGIEVSYGVIPADGASPFVHYHKANEETYVFLSGEGIAIIDKVELSIKAGSFLRVAPAGRRFIKNTSTTPIIYLCIQAKEGSLGTKNKDDGMIE